MRIREAFWRTLESLGVKTRFRWTFGDHHRYNIRQIRRLGRRAQLDGVEALVTTEKDLANLCKGASELVAPLRIYALVIGVEVEDGDRLLQLIARAR